MLSALIQLACGDDSRPSSFPPTDAGGDAGTLEPEPDSAVGMPDHDASQAPSFEAGPPEAGPASPEDSSSPFAPMTLLSNTPNAVLVHQSVVELLHLRLLSSNLSNSLPGYWRWFGEIKNATSQAWCDPSITLTFLDGDGAVVWTMAGTVGAPLHEATEGEAPLPCVAAGDSVGAWGIEAKAGGPDLASIETIRFETFGESRAGTEPHRATPALGSTAIDSSNQGDPGTPYRVTGSLLGQDDLVTYVGVEIFAKDEQGLIFDVLRAARTDPLDGRLAVGEAWSFATTTTTHPISSVRAKIEFVP